MINFKIYSCICVTFMLFYVVSCTVLEHVINEASSCEKHCETIYSTLNDSRKACEEGCRLFKVIDLAKTIFDGNKTLDLCVSACSDAFLNESSNLACRLGCRKEETISSMPKDSPQTLHLLTPLVYVKSAYNTMAHHIRQFISTSWTVYVQEDSGKMVVLQSKPKIVETYVSGNPRESSSNLQGYKQNWQEERLDWMDCISQQSGLPRRLLVVVLSGFILALLWLCCVMAVTAPNQHMQKKNVRYLLLCEPNSNEMKSPIPPPLYDEQAPPLPEKATLI